MYPERLPRAESLSVTQKRPLASFASSDERFGHALFYFGIVAAVYPGVARCNI
jgi:hypothetical protein